MTGNENPQPRLTNDSKAMSANENDEVDWLAGKALSIDGIVWSFFCRQRITLGQSSLN